MFPRIIKNYNMIFDGNILAGLCEEVNLGKLSRKLEEYRNGGMNGSADLDLGQEKMEIDFTLTGYNDEILKKYGINAIDGVGARFVAAEVGGDDLDPVAAIEITVRGRLKEIDFGTVKAGEKNTKKCAMTLVYFKYTKNGEDLIELDVVNMIEKVGGVDRLKEVRAAISMT